MSPGTMSGTALLPKAKTSSFNEPHLFTIPYILSPRILFYISITTDSNPGCHHLLHHPHSLSLWSYLLLLCYHQTAISPSQFSPLLLGPRIFAWHKRLFYDPTKLWHNFLDSSSQPLPTNVLWSHHMELCYFQYATCSEFLFINLLSPYLCTYHSDFLALRPFTLLSIQYTFSPYGEWCIL